MDLHDWWKRRLIEKKADFEKAVEQTVGSIVSKLQSRLERVDLSQQIALLERNIARGEKEALEQKMGNLLAVIHRDGGHYIDEHGFDAAIEDAKDVVYRDRTALDLERHRCLHWLDEVLEGGSDQAMPLVSARRKIEMGVAPEEEPIQPTFRVVSSELDTVRIRRSTMQPVSHETGRVPKQGLVCELECSRQLVRASGDAICSMCNKPYRKHPYCRGCISTISGEPEYFIHVACDGLHLKP
jgi:hypothetical protein